MIRSVVNDTAPPDDACCLSSAAVNASDRGLPSTSSDSGPAFTSDRPSLPSNVQSPITEVGGSALIRSLSAPTTLPSLVLPPSSVVIDCSSMMIAAGPFDGVVTVLANVARIASSPTDSVDGSAGNLVTSLLGGLTPSTRKPAFANSASCPGLCMNWANPLAAVTWSCDSHDPLSATVGES